MSGVATAIVGSAYITSQAASRAGRRAEGAQNTATAAQQAQYDQTREDQAPWRAAGERALPQLESYGAASMDGWETDPGYQFRLSEGMRALQQGKAAHGQLNQGNTLRALSDYGQGQASQEYGNVWNRRQSENTTGFNRLASLAGLGQTANTALQSAGQNYANQVGQGAMNSAAIQGNAGMARANAWGGAINSLSQLGGRHMAGQNNAQPSFGGSWGGGVGGAGSFSGGSVQGNSDYLYDL